MPFTFWHTSIGWIIINKQPSKTANNIVLSTFVCIALMWLQTNENVHIWKLLYQRKKASKTKSFIETFLKVNSCFHEIFWNQLKIARIRYHDFEWKKSNYSFFPFFREKCRIKWYVFSSTQFSPLFPHCFLALTFGAIHLQSHSQTHHTDIIHLTYCI